MSAESDVYDRIIEEFAAPKPTPQEPTPQVGEVAFGFGEVGAPAFQQVIHHVGDESIRVMTTEGEVRCIQRIKQVSQPDLRFGDLVYAWCPVSMPWPAEWTHGRWPPFIARAGALTLATDESGGGLSLPPEFDADGQLSMVSG